MRECQSLYKLYFKMNLAPAMPPDLFTASSQHAQSDHCGTRNPSSVRIAAGGADRGGCGAFLVGMRVGAIPDGAHSDPKACAADVVSGASAGWRAGRET